MYNIHISIVYGATFFFVLAYYIIFISLSIDPTLYLGVD